MRGAAGRQSQPLGKGCKVPEDAGVCAEAPSVTEEEGPAVDGAWAEGVALVPSSPGRLSSAPHTGPKTSVSQPASPAEVLTDTSKLQHLAFKKL